MLNCAEDTDYLQRKIGSYRTPFECSEEKSIKEAGEGVSTFNGTIP